MNVPSLTSSNLTDDLTDAMGAVAAPVVAAAGAVTAEAVGLATSMAETVAKGGLVKQVTTTALPAAWGLARRHPVLAVAALLGVLVAFLWRRQRSSTDDTAVTTTNRPSPVTAAA